MEVGDMFFVPGATMPLLWACAHQAKQRLGHRYKVFRCIRHGLNGVMVKRIE